MIHVCFALYDKAGHYSKFLGTAMLSLFENINTPPPVSVFIHLLHDNTLTDDNRDKLIQIAERYGAPLKFYNVEELCTEEIAKIKEFFPNIGIDRHSIAMFYRFFIVNLLPQEIEKVLYLDADIMVNLDINEFWQIELGDKPFAAVPEFYQISDKDASIASRKKSISVCREGVVNPEDYFNSGVMFMNLKIMSAEEATISAGMKFISEHPQFAFLDQDILNYCFSTSYLKLPVKFNRFVLYAQLEDDGVVQESIYHFAASRMCFTMDMNDPYNRLWMSYFMKTPYVDFDTRVALSGDIPSRKNFAVSVIIPMYNAEDTIRECLDGLLIQTFQAFEVIVVDDCSIDDSVKIVEEYAPKFNGRLRLEKTEKNSGTGGHVARNIGLLLARGDYVYFVDADDMILGNALETLYKAAIFYDAEVVYASSYYSLKAPNDIYLSLDGLSKKNLKVKTEFIFDDPNKNQSRLFHEGNREIANESWTKSASPGNDLAAWTKLISRDFLLRNKIFFAEIATSGDVIFTINLYCHAKRFVRISTPLYIHRSYNYNSITRTNRSQQETCSFWFSSLVDFAKVLHELQKKNEVLAENPIYCLEVLRIQFTRFLKLTEEARHEFDSREIYKVLHDELVKSSDDLSTLLLPFLIGFIDNEKKFSDYYIEPINRFKNYLTARIDIKLIATGVDFQIISVSDTKAAVRKPNWLQRGGLGYMIQSHVGELKIVAKSNVDGQIELSLKSLDIRSSKINFKRIPQWIDYTKLTINGETIFDTVTPTWHDKAYQYAMDVKADEEIKIEVEWLPHRDTRSDVSEVVAKIPDKNTEKLREYEALISELRTALNNAKKDADEQRALVSELPTVLDNEKQAHNSDVALISKFKDYFTARLDIKLMSTEGDVKILSVSDSDVKITQPVWMQKDGAAYIITSYVGELEFVACASVDGQICLWLRGLDMRDPEDNSKRIPYWIDYTRLVINDKTMFDKVTPIWHDKPYRYNVNVKANEKIKIKVEWLPHRSDT